MEVKERNTKITATELLSYTAAKTEILLGTHLKVS